MEFNFLIILEMAAIKYSFMAVFFNVIVDVKITKFYVIINISFFFLFYAEIWAFFLLAKQEKTLRMKFLNFQLHFRIEC